LKVCILCGQRAVADGFLNLLLFFPFGWVLGGTRGITRTAGWGFLASFSIEAIQLFIPGRYTSFADLVANTLGAGAGAYAAGAKTLPVRSAAITVSVLLFLPLLMLKPAPPAGGVYFGQWTPSLGRMEVYRGRILSATVGNTVVRSWRSDATAALRKDLENGSPIRIRLQVGPPPAAQAPVFSIFDDRQRGAFMLGADGTDLFIRLRRMGTTFGLQTPTWWWKGAMEGFRIGDTIRVTYGLSGRSPCLSVEGHTRCLTASADLGSWSLLAPADRGGAVIRLVGLLWAFLLGAPLGMLSFSFRGKLLLTTGIGVGVAILSTASAYWIAPWWGLLLMFTGMIAGSVVEPWIRKTLRT